MQNYLELEKYISTVQADVSTIEEDIRAIETDVSAPGADVSAIETDVSAPGEDGRAIETDVSAPGADVSAIETDVFAPGEDVRAIETNVSAPGADVSAIEIDVSAAETDVSVVQIILSVMKKRTKKAKIKIFPLLASPSSLALDDKGTLYVFDRRLVKLFKFDSNFRFIAVFGNKGRGPGDVGTGISQDYSRRKLNCRKNGHLLITDSFNRKVLEFDPNGILTGEYPVECSISFYPLIDAQDRIYLPSEDGGTVIDVLDKKSEKIHSFLDRKELYRFLNFTPQNDWMVEMLGAPRPDFFFYDMLPDGLFAVYIGTNSTFFLFENFKLKKRFTLFPDGALKIHREMTEESEENRKTLDRKFPSPRGRRLSYFPIFAIFFVDKDNGRYFYLQGYKYPEKNALSLYKFDLQGKLIKVLVLKSDQYINFLVKKNNVFYRIGGESVFIINEVK